MAKYKEPEKYIYQAKAIEYLHCLQDMTHWRKIVADQLPDKPYTEFLKILNSNECFRNEQNFTLKMLAEKSGIQSPKVTKWLKEIYEDIITLNNYKPALFCEPNGLSIDFYFYYRGNGVYLRLSLPVLPRVNESFDFYFLKASFGIGNFWVKEVSYEIGENSNRLVVTLEAGYVNKYRELILDKATFMKVIDVIGIYRMHELDIDDKLRKMERGMY